MKLHISSDILLFDKENSLKNDHLSIVTNEELILKSRNNPDKYIFALVSLFYDTDETATPLTRCTGIILINLIYDLSHIERFWSILYLNGISPLGYIDKRKVNLIHYLVKVFFIRLPSQMQSQIQYFTEHCVSQQDVLLYYHTIIYGKAGSTHTLDSDYSKLMKDIILENEKYNNCISWTEKGDAFVVLNSHIFSSEVLPEVFKHSNFDSFVRQLNLYSFSKVNRTYHRHNSITFEERSLEPKEFFHEKFRRDRPDLITKILRKNFTLTKRRSLESSYSSSSSSSSLKINIPKKKLSSSSLRSSSEVKLSNSCNSNEPDIFSSVSDSPTKTDWFFDDIFTSTRSTSPSTYKGSSPSSSRKGSQVSFQDLSSSYQVQSELTYQGYQTRENFENLNVSGSTIQVEEKRYVSVFSETEFMDLLVLNDDESSTENTASQKSSLDVSSLLAPTKPDGSPLNRYLS
ncbi:kinase-regulated stress-responsive transcription factor skn7 [Lobulomyces angularis]|nr:kinase-regulated stress-responsive transcription factor skn7 [Lobulomyces angularis]